MCYLSQIDFDSCFHFCFVFRFPALAPIFVFGSAGVFSLILLRYVETSSGKHVIHKKVGDTVELSSGLPTEGVTAATWKYGKIIIADKDIETNTGVTKGSPFKDRSELNHQNFTLTVRKLTLQDSGDFIFVSATKEKQRDSVIITLQVHDPIAKPDIKISSTWISSNESCKVLLECSTTGDVSYKWTVGKQTLTGPRQQYIIREQDGETNFTCTISNNVSEKSAFQTVKATECSNSTQKDLVSPYQDIS
uniref:Ig-like domain-containing protein n=1 Tax=Neolamprologus brichardi TaxID=32507 RepID=A0A3Q4G4N2_NEOBR